MACFGIAALAHPGMGRNARGPRYPCGRRRHDHRAGREASAASGQARRHRRPERRQAFSKRSTEHLSKLVRRQIVTVEWYKNDRYGRLVGNVCVKGMDVGLEQLRAGLAWHYKRFEREQTPENRSRYAKAETMARAARAGLWQDKEALPPWEWRARQRASSTMNSLNAHRGR